MLDKYIFGLGDSFPDTIFPIPFSNNIKKIFRFKFIFGCDSGKKIQCKHEYLKCKLCD